MEGIHQQSGRYSSTISLLILLLILYTMCLSKLNQTNPVEINVRINERSSIACRDSSFSSFDTDNTIRSSGTSSTTRSASQNQKPSSRKLKSTRIATPTLAKNEPSIRSSYLHKLGVISDSDVEHGLNALKIGYNKSCKAVACFEYVELLKEDTDIQQTRMMPFSRTSTLSTTIKRPRAVSFDNEVNVRVIPSKDMYSKRVKQDLWTTEEDLEANARRNLVEFESEGRDFSKAVEDDDFVTCPRSGEKVHPCHVHWIDHRRAKSQFRQFSRV